MSETSTGARFPTVARFPYGAGLLVRERFPSRDRLPAAPACRGLARRTAKLFPDEP